MKDYKYWKEYNSQRKEYLTQKKRESRAKTKMSTTNSPWSTTEPLKVVDTNLSIVDKVVDQLSNKSMSTTQSQLWTNYYSVKKPFCFSCQTQGIKETEYKFCSQEKEPVNFYFKNIYLCQVYHWTIYQLKTS